MEVIALRAATEALTDSAGGLQILDEAIARLDVDKAKPLRQVRLMMLAQQNRKVEVEQDFQELIRDFPKDKDVQYQLARFYASEGRVDEAEKVLRNVVTLVPDDVSSQLSLAQFLAQMRGAEAAEQTLVAFVAENPNQPELRATLGRLYETNGKPDEALAVYEELAKREGKSAAGIAARVRVAALRLGKGEMDTGAQLIDAVLVEAPDNVDALLMRAGLRLIDRKFEEAIADIRTVLRYQPEDARAILVLARTHALMDERTLAKEEYRQLLKVDPKNANAPGELALLENQDENYAAAEAVLRERLELMPNDIDAGVRLITLLGSQKAWRKAEDEARRMDALPDDKGEGQVQLGRLMLAQDRRADAEAAFRKALDKNSSSLMALDGLVSILTNMGLKDEATQTLQLFRRKYPDDLGALFLEGQVLAHDGNVAAAEKIFNQVVFAQPTATKVWIALAGLREDAATRIKVYERAVAANRGDAELGLLLGTEYAQARRYEDAITNYQQFLLVKPGIDSELAGLAVNNLAALLLDYRTDRASHARALEVVKSLENSTNPAVLDTVGWAYYRNQNFPKAVEMLEAAVEGADTMPILHYHLGMAYLANKNQADGRKELRIAVGAATENFPGLSDAKYALAKLGN